MRAIGMAWFREEDYPALLQIFDDSNEMPHTWKAWLKDAEQMESRAKAGGYTAERIYIDPDGFPDWCLREGMHVNNESLQKFVIDTVAAKYAEQS
jgi:hypothetical protein